MSAVLKHIAQIADQDAQRIALEDADGKVTYGELWAMVQKCSHDLMLQRPHAVAIALPNSTAWVVAHLGCVHANLPQVPLPPFFTKAQQEHALRDAGVTLLITKDGMGEPIVLGRDIATMMKLANSSTLLPQHTVMVTYTSGSTGTPKGICLSQQGMEQVAKSLVSVLGSALAQRHLSVLPLAVLLEQVGGLYTTLLAGGTYVILAATSMQNLAHALRTSHAVSCILVPELLKELLAKCAHHPDPFPHVKFIAVGGARVAESLLLEAKAVGLPVYQGYGLSESASVVSVNTPQHNKLGTAGKLLPHIDCIVDADGEIVLHDPALLGYTGGSGQGDYSTGDLGAMDADGYLTIHGRKKNILITGYGRNVSPEWLESLLLAQPEIAQSMAYGDGEATISALIVPVPSANQSALKQAVERVNAVLPDYARIGRWEAVVPFTQANGMLTGTGRIKREAITQWISQNKESSDEFLRSISA